MLIIAPAVIPRSTVVSLAAPAVLAMDTVISLVPAATPLAHSSIGPTS